MKQRELACCARIEHTIDNCGSIIGFVRVFAFVGSNIMDKRLLHSYGGQPTRVHTQPTEKLRKVQHDKLQVTLKTHFFCQQIRLIF